MKIKWTKDNDNQNTLTLNDFESGEVFSMQFTENSRLVPCLMSTYGTFTDMVSGKVTHPLNLSYYKLFKCKSELLIEIK